jgi:lysine 2,3-aminomutase
MEGLFTGYNTPRFIVDLPNGGGKTNIFSFEEYDKNYGRYIYKSSVKPSQIFYYYEPLRILNPLQKKKINNEKK